MEEIEELIHANNIEDLIPYINVSNAEKIAKLAAENDKLDIVKYINENYNISIEDILSSAWSSDSWNVYHYFMNDISEDKEYPDQEDEENEDYTRESWVNEDVLE